MMTKIEILILCFCAIAAVLHGLSGFGFPMVSTAILSIFYPLHLAVAMVIIPCIILNLSLLKTKTDHRFTYYLKNYWGLMVSSLIGSFIGVSLLLYIHEGYLKLLMGSVILLYVFNQFQKQPLYIRSSLSNMLIFGGLAGVIGGATNAMAPFLMMYLLSTKHQKNDIVMISNMSFLSSKIIQLMMLSPSILAFNQTQVYLLAVITTVALCFVYIGSRIRARISQRMFNIIIFFILFVLGCQSIWQGLNLLA